MCASRISPITSNRGLRGILADRVESVAALIPLRHVSG
jgi:hypothetical protein